MKDLSKFERIQLLRQFGMNTPVMCAFGTNAPTQVHDVLLEWPFEKVSIRTSIPVEKKRNDVDIDWHAPFFHFLDPADAFKIYITERLNKYDVILTESIAREEKIVGGNVILFSERRDVWSVYHMIDQPIAIFEFFTGPGTIRDMADGKVERHHLVAPLYGHLFTYNRHKKLSFSPYNKTGIFRLLQKVLRIVRRFPYAYGNHVEFSFEGMKHGWRNDHIIFWEVRA